jgi:hypothetical protein
MYPFLDQLIHSWLFYAAALEQASCGLNSACLSLFRFENGAMVVGVVVVVVRSV